MEHRLFPGTFPTLFWNNQPGHLYEGFKTSKINYQTWFSSLLKHHTRQFAKHPTFMHVAFDIQHRHQVNSAANIIVSRSNWKQKSQDIHSLTEKQLHIATKELENNLPVTIKPVFSLLACCSAIGHFIPLSNENRNRMRANIKGNIIRFGLPAIWLTINPADLAHPILCKIAGVSLSPSLNLTPSQIQLLKSKTATTNPVASAQFFHKMITSFYDTLVMPVDGSVGVFGDIESYFSTTETNGRDALHLHGFLWLRGNIEMDNLRQKILLNESGIFLNPPISLYSMLIKTDFQNRVVKYLEHIFREDIDLTMKPPININFDLNGGSIPYNLPQALFHQAIIYDGHSVASLKNMHRHSYSCKKYGSSACRFGCPWPLVAKTNIDQQGIFFFFFYIKSVFI